MVNDRTATVSQPRIAVDRACHAAAAYRSPPRLFSCTRFIPSFSSASQSGLQPPPEMQSACQTTGRSSSLQAQPSGRQPPSKADVRNLMPIGNPLARCVSSFQPLHVKSRLVSHAHAHMHMHAYAHQCRSETGARKARQLTQDLLQAPSLESSSNQIGFSKLSSRPIHGRQPTPRCSTTKTFTALLGHLLQLRWHRLPQGPPPGGVQISSVLDPGI